MFVSKKRLQNNERLNGMRRSWPLLKKLLLLSKRSGNESTGIRKMKIRRRKARRRKRKKRMTSHTAYDIVLVDIYTASHVQIALAVRVLLRYHTNNLHLLQETVRNMILLPLLVVISESTEDKTLR
jgi:hypothetical protein